MSPFLSHNTVYTCDLVTIFTTITTLLVTIIATYMPPLFVWNWCALVFIAWYQLRMLECGLLVFAVFEARGLQRRDNGSLDTYVKVLY